jgi:hypothetical protein
MAVQPRQQSWVQLLGAFEPLRSRTAEQLVDAFCDCTKIVNLLQESLYIAFDILDVFNVFSAALNSSSSNFNAKCSNMIGELDSIISSYPIKKPDSCIKVT